MQRLHAVESNWIVDIVKFQNVNIVAPHTETVAIIYFKWMYMSVELQALMTEGAQMGFFNWGGPSCQQSNCQQGGTRSDTAVKSIFQKSHSAHLKSGSHHYLD